MREYCNQVRNITCTRTHMDTPHTCTHARTHTHTHTRTHKHTYTRTHKHTHTHVHVNTHTYIYIHAHIQTHTQICIAKRKYFGNCSRVLTYILCSVVFLTITNVYTIGDANTSCIITILYNNIIYINN